ncbi:MAG: 2-oxoacid:ferredoxin oxidoreductase subunit beta [Myxococcota bacterium]|nr:2-oxoacid:ferredoxin oxidoreductase subunit beta [Myxococcota bacterium]
MSEQEEPTSYTKKDFMSDQTIRWCPGCGDYAILSQVQTTFAELGIPRHKFAVVSGIGCSSRFPYYMNTYGFHTIHGRAPAFATGLKLANPELSVWVITGDGDALSIGGNHLIHVLRRNVDLQLLLFNNRIYGLTKGQYSPTSPVGTVKKSTPQGSIDHPFEPCAVALGADASFVARTIDVFTKDQRKVLRQAEAHRGSSFVEIYQNCNIFNDGAFDDIRDRKLRDERLVFVEHGKPLVFGGKDGPPKGLQVDNRMKLSVVELDNGITEDDIMVHDETNPVMANLLVRMRDQFPVAMGVIYRVQRPTYDQGVVSQVEQATSSAGARDLHRALHSGNTWTVS